MGFQKDDIYALYPETLAIGPSLTPVIPPMPYQSFTTLKSGGGGTLLIIADAVSPYGSSFAISQRYPLGPSEIFNFNGCGQIRLGTLGATALVFMVRGLTAGSTQL